MKKYLVALDQGTTSSRAIVFDRSQQIVASAQKEFPQLYPQAGWVEHDPLELYSSQYGVMMEAITRGGIDPAEIAAIGITNQRETTIVWEKATGRPIYPAIVWQCRRTAALCDRLRADGLTEHIRAVTGLVPDAYFSATKIRWILDHVPGAQEHAERGELLFGNVDSWLIWNLTGGRAHVSDYSNCSRTMLFDIDNLCWDEELCARLGVPMSMLPTPVPSSMVYGQVTAGLPGLETLEGIPVCGSAGDQAAALLGQACIVPGQAKNTYGTGCFLLMNTGDTPCMSRNGLLTTIAIGLDGKVQYALEGSVFVGGAVIQWLRDEMRFITESKDAEYYAQKVEDTGGVYLVPAFTGLGAPYWKPDVRGAIFGLTRGTTQEHIIRATLESLAYQSMDVLRAMEEDLGIRIDSLKADGGASRNGFLMQFQSDLLDVEVVCPDVAETTALGAAALAGLAVGFWKDQDEIRRLTQHVRLFHPQMGEEEREKLTKGWKKAVAAAAAFDVV